MAVPGLSLAGSVVSLAETRPGRTKSAAAAKADLKNDVLNLFLISDPFALTSSFVPEPSAAAMDVLGGVRFRNNNQFEIRPIQARFRFRERMNI